MRYEKRYLITLLSSAIRKKTPPAPVQPVDWQEIRKIAEEQKILPVIYDAVSALNESERPEPEIMAKWQQETLTCTLFFAFQLQEIKSTLKKADENGLDVLVLKGTVLRELYPVPELRTMSDCDILVKKEQLDLVDKVFTSCGYKIPDDSPNQLVYHKDGALKFEVFYTVPSGLKSLDGREVKIWENTENFLGEHVVKPSAENMLLHSVTHLVKHLRTCGTGIRNVADIILLLEKEELDWEYILNQIKLMNLEDIFYGLLHIAEKYFDCKIPIECPPQDDDYIDKLMQYMVSHGVYGVKGNAFILDARTAEGKKGKRVVNYIKKMLPAPSKLSDKYMYAKKLPVLLPVAWIHRSVNVVLKRGNTVGENIKSMQTASDIVNKQLEILEYFNIK